MVMAGASWPGLARQAEDPLADDVALDLGRTTGDGFAEGLEVVLDPGLGIGHRMDALQPIGLTHRLGKRRVDGNGRIRPADQEPFEQREKRDVQPSPVGVAARAGTTLEGDRPVLLAR